MTYRKLQRELREMGCPFDVGDGRAAVWLDGYRAGLAEGHKLATKVLAA